MTDPKQATPPLPPTRRFSNRAQNYMLYRPTYPDAVVSFLETELGLQPFHRIADIGSGTGLFAEILLQKNYNVTCIEPNEDMRWAGEQKLRVYKGYTCRSGKAEETGLPDQSVDFITVAQAFHWMEFSPTQKEFSRILKPSGHIILAWNIRLLDSDFSKAYEQLIHKYALEPYPVSKVDEAAISQFFLPHSTQTRTFDNSQALDFDRLKGQLLSSSYMPLPGQDRYDEMIEALVQIFISHQKNGLVNMDYATRVFWNSY